MQHHSQLSIKLLRDKKKVKCYQSFVFLYTRHKKRSPKPAASERQQAVRVKPWFKTLLWTVCVCLQLEFISCMIAKTQEVDRASANPFSIVWRQWDKKKGEKVKKLSQCLCERVNSNMQAYVIKQWAILMMDIWIYLGASDGWSSFCCVFAATCVKTVGCHPPYVTPSSKHVCVQMCSSFRALICS